MVVKNLPANAVDTKDGGSAPGSGRSPGEGNGNPLQYSCLGNSMPRGARWATIHGVAEFDMTEWLSTHIPLFSSVSLHFPFRKAYFCLLFSGTLHSDEYIFPFISCLSFLFFLQLLVKTPGATTLPSCISFFLGMVLVTTSCTILRTSIHSFSGTLSTRSNP